MKINAIYKGKIEEAFFKDRLDAYKASRQTDILGKILEKIKSTPFTIPKELLASIYFRSGDEQHYEPESQINAELMYALNRNINAQNKDRIINYIARSVFDRYSPNYDYEKFIKNATSAVSFSPKTEPAAVDPVVQATQAQTPTAQTLPEAPPKAPANTSVGLSRNLIDSALNNAQAKETSVVVGTSSQGNAIEKKPSEIALRTKLSEITRDPGFKNGKHPQEVIYSFLNNILDKIPIKDSKEYNEISLLREGLKDLYHSATDPAYQQYITGEETNEKKEQIGVVHTIRKIVEKMIEMYIQETDKILQTKGSNIQDYTRQIDQYMTSQKYAHKSNKANELTKKYSHPGSAKNYDPNWTAGPTTDPYGRQEESEWSRPDKMDRYVEPDTDPDPYGRKEEPAWGESANSYSGQQFVFEADWYES